MRRRPVRPISKELFCPGNKAPRDWPKKGNHEVEAQDHKARSMNKSAQLLKAFVISMTHIDNFEALVVAVLVVRYSI